MATGSPVAEVDAPSSAATDRDVSSPRRQRQYLHGVQGLRTVAALMVAVYHIWFHRVSGGVDVFFVVAGYFAAGSILRITSEPTARARWSKLAHYWLRTARRVVPSAVVVIVGTVVAAMLFLPRSHWESSIPHGWASLGFWQNWYLIETGNNYLLQGITASPFQQFWALAIQVQSYVVFPLIALLAAVLARFLRGSQRRALFLAVAVAFAISLAWSIQLTATNQAVAYFHLGTRMWEFLAGTVLALVLRKPVGNLLVMRVLGWAGLAAILSFAAFVDPSELLPGVVALVPVTAAAAIIAAARLGVEPRILSARPLLWFADSSFAFYLWHWPVLVLYRWQFRETVSLKAGLAILVLSAILAVLTTKLVEKPIRDWKRLQASAGATVLACALLMLPAAGALTAWDLRNAAQQEADLDAVASVLAGIPPAEGQIVPAPAIARLDRSVAYELDCQQGTRGEAVVTCTWGDESSDVTIALVGASQDTQWIDLVATVAEELGVRLVTMTKGGCPFGDVAAGDVDVHASCPVWADAVLSQLLADPPDLVFTMATRNAGEGESVPTWKLPYFEQLSAAGIPVLALRANPRYGFDVPGCVETRGADACSVPRSQVLVPSGELAVPSLSRFTFLDLGDHYCTPDVCPAVQDGLLVSWDGYHLTRTWTLVNGGPVREAITAILE